MYIYYFMGDLRATFKKAEPFIAIGIFIMLIVIGTLLFREQQLKKEISENCGWGKDDYYCYCEKSESMEVKNKMEGVDLSLLNVNGWEDNNATLAR